MPMYGPPMVTYISICDPSMTTYISIYSPSMAIFGLPMAPKPLPIASGIISISKRNIIDATFRDSYVDEAVGIVSGGRSGSRRAGNLRMSAAVCPFLARRRERGDAGLAERAGPL